MKQLIRSTPAGHLAFALSASLWLGLAHAQSGPPPSTPAIAAQCLTRTMLAASDTATIGELRAACAAEAASVAMAAPATADQANAAPLITRRLAAERDAQNNLYTITAHRPNYFLLGNYTSSRPSNATFARGGEHEAQKVESKFQISLKALVLQDAFNGAGDIFLGYTQRSFWQMYNRDASSPFRETNYEPEAWLRHVVNRPVLGWNVSTVALGLNHQSNGRGDATSRSWNRVIGSVAFERGDTGVVLRPWWRIPESEAKDNNPDIDKYMGNFELTVLRRYGKNAFDLMLRNNLRSDNHGAVQLGWSYPLTPTLRAYAQLFSGYGESLVDYNVRQTSVGVGLQLLEW